MKTREVKDDLIKIPLQVVFVFQSIIAAVFVLIVNENFNIFYLHFINIIMQKIWSFFLGMK